MSKIKDKKKEPVEAIVTYHAILLNRQGVDLLLTVEKLEAEIKEAKALLKPIVEATVKHFGETTIEIDGFKVQLKEVVRCTASWKAIAYAVASEEEILAVKPDFVVESTSYSAKVKV